ncbi:YciK family oxidoreductase [Halioxenophilus sp. WMMB6]|uniref:YciK family oxidoreductase n=1 Tax=Halioxenophilus sp. WMMB6 TaxID=3073815 RepID=UPI00295ED47C|nr:YciK family oxidoreductase [Halioxenophilus sp. WMMB6]
MKLPDNYTPTANCLAGKVIVVTGAGAGIGREAALTYARYGANVVLLGRTTAKLEQVYDQIEAEGSPNAAIYPINFEGAVEKDYLDMAVRLEEEYGKIDGLLINAAILGQHTPINNYAVDTWNQVMQINLNSPFMMIKALAPLLAASGNGSVITTSSSVANAGRAFWGAYAVSKAALKNLTEILAQEWDEVIPVRINSLNPGGTRTTMRAQAYPAENPADVPPPSEHMPLYLYLMSDDSLGVSGQYFNARQ